jgi:8-oxo-dGTP pyrophosphatase MutT (NUDIX family)
MAQYTPFEVVITAIIHKDDTYLITRRSMSKKRFPGLWTVPGGHLDPADFTSLPKETADYWYNILEKVLRREVKEEVGIEIDNIEYVTSLATVHEDDLSGRPISPSLVISCLADYVSGEVKLQLEETDKFEWVTLAQAKDMPLIDGIYDELVMAEDKRLNPRAIKSEWKRT